MMPGLGPDPSSGIGLREPHYNDILTQKPAVGFLEAHSENFFRIGGVPFQYLMKCRETYPVSALRMWARSRSVARYW